MQCVCLRVNDTSLREDQKLEKFAFFPRKFSFTSQQLGSRLQKKLCVFLSSVIFQLFSTEYVVEEHEMDFRLANADQK